LVIKDPNWAHPERSLSKANDEFREMLAGYIRSELSGRDDLIEKSIPSYPPFGKRLLLDHGWYKSLMRSNVNLVTDRITEIREDSVVTDKGDVFPVEIIVFATGYDVQRFLSSFEVRGLSGRSLRETWGDDDGRAYLGCAIPDFPNFFCLYGPNSQPAHGGSFFAVAEQQTEFVTSAISLMLEKHLKQIEIKQETLDTYIAEIDAAHERMVWTHPGTNTYYRNSRGRVVINSPFLNYDFWKRTSRADLADFKWMKQSQRGV
jgi:4-hydroxyacetophenone monooxygenase